MALSIGDPAGIGPEVALRAAHDPELRAVARLVLIGAPEALRRASAVVGLRCDFPPPGRGDEGPWLLPVEERDLPPWGAPSPAGGAMAGRAIEEGVRLVKEGCCEALTTCPVNKAALKAGGYEHMGHTRMLAELDGAAEVAMVFRSPRLSVVLLTDHVPLAEVPRLLTKARVVRAVRLALDLYGKCGEPAPRVAVAGLNPHAGEGGLLGREEVEVLAPAVEELREGGCEVSGPHPPDTVYLRALSGDFELVASPYHDQGLVAVKTMGRGAAVHFTAGLSFIRTSVDHGTACDIAGTGRADAGPLVAAVREAARVTARGG